MTVCTLGPILSEHKKIFFKNKQGKKNKKINVYTWNK